MIFTELVFLADRKRYGFSSESLKTTGWLRQNLLHNLKLKVMTFLDNNRLGEKFTISLSGQEKEMKITRMLVVGMSLSIITVLFMGSAQADCKTVNGHITSEVFTGDDCPSPLGLCTFGRFIGGLKGNFVFVAEALVPNPDTENPDVQFTTGSIELETKKGNLTLRDASAVSFGPDGLFGSVQTVVGGTGDFTGATGRIRAYGVFLGGCVNCDYRGEICTL